MTRLVELYQILPARLGGAKRVGWLILTLLIGPIYLLARQVEPVSFTVFKQLGILYLIDTVLFFFVGGKQSKIELLTLNFLGAMEIVVVIYYLISLYSQKYI